MARHSINAAAWPEVGYDVLVAGSRERVSPQLRNAETRRRLKRPPEVRAGAVHR
jgi:hypothetical protein